MSSITAIPDQVRRTRYVATAGQTAFPTGWPILAASDLAVLRVRAGVATALGLAADYSVTGDGTEEGATVTLNTGATAGDVLVLVSAQPYARISQFTDNGPLRAMALEDELNRIIVQELQLRDGLAMAVRAPTVDGPLAELPPATVRAGKLAAWDNAGNPAVLPQTLVASPTPPSQAYNWVHADAFGAKGDGTTDDTAALQAAHDALGATGGVVWLSPKPYRLAGTVTVTTSVIFRGQGFQEVSTGRAGGSVARPGFGTWLIHDNTSVPALRFTGVGAAGSGLQDLAFFEPGHSSPGTGWTPTAYGPCVQLDTGANGFQMKGRVHFHNINKWLDADWCDRITIDTVTGQAFTFALQINHSYDIGSLNNFRLWAYWSENANVLNYMQAHTDAMLLPTPDCLQMQSVFCICCRSGITVPTGDGLTHTLWVDQLYTDFTGIAVLLNAPYLSVRINQLFHLGQAFGGTTALSGACAVKSTGTSNQVVISQLVSTLCDYSCVILTGTNNLVILGSLIVSGYNSHNDGSPVLDTGSNVYNTILLNGIHNVSGAYGGPLFGGGTNHAGQQFGLAQINYSSNVAGGAVNFPRFNAGPTGNAPTLYPTGPDTNIGLSLIAKGSGDLTLSTTGFVNVASPVIAGGSGGLSGYFEMKINGNIVKVPYHAP